MKQCLDFATTDRRARLDALAAGPKGPAYTFFIVFDLGQGGSCHWTQKEETATCASHGDGDHAPAARVARDHSPDARALRRSWA